MKRLSQRGPRSRTRPYDDMMGEHPDPYDDFPEYIEAMLDGACGASGSHHGHVLGALRYNPGH